VTDEPDDNDKRPDWYPQPGSKTPVERSEGGRFKKNHSGNPKGRPPKKAVPFSTRALTRDFIAESERMIEVNGEQLPIMRLLIRQIFADAVKGNHRAQDRIFELHQGAISTLEYFNRRANSDLSTLEQYIIDLGLEDDPDVQRQLNASRVKAKKI
jgi:hypothetical protein